MMNRRSLEDCHTITGVAVVIDVLRAFTTAAFGFGAGASEIVLTDTVENAFILRDKTPQSLLVGEVNGYPIEGFDFSNSPAVFKYRTVPGRVLIQRTSSGTQGVIRSSAAQAVFAASFSNAAATALALRQFAGQEISFVNTGGDEDAACSDYIEALFHGTTPNTELFAKRIRESEHGQRFTEVNHYAFPREDLETALEFNRFNFAMRVFKENGCVLRALIP